MPKLLELFSGQGTISATFAAYGWETYKVDWSENVEADLHADIKDLLVCDVIELCGGIPDVIWASPQCTTYSIATHIHRTLTEGAKSQLAKDDDQVNIFMWDLIDQLLIAGTKYYFVENPRGRMRSMWFVKDRPRFTVTYCTYGRRGNYKGYENFYQMKPTDIWTNYPNPQFAKPCNTKNPPHEHSNMKRASKRDYLSRGEIPEELRKHIVNICDKLPAN